MSWITKLRDTLSRKREAQELTESDAPADTGPAPSRATGGDKVDEQTADDNDLHSTTGTSESETFVGRAGGADEGYAGLTGAEARADAERADEKPS